MHTKIASEIFPSGAVEKQKQNDTFRVSRIVKKKTFDCVSGDKGRVRFEGEGKSANVLGKSEGEKTRRRKKSKNVCWMLRTHKRSAREMREKVVVQIT